MQRDVFLSGSAIDLVLLTIEDSPTMQGFMNDHEITQFLGRGAVPMYRKNEDSWLDSLPKDGHLILGIWHKADEALIGSCGLHEIDHLSQLAELGILIGHKDYWGGGYGKAAVRLICAHGFNWLNLRHITLRVLGNNPRGRRCYERCGFWQTGVIPGHVYKAGEWHDEVHMLCTKDTLAPSDRDDTETRVSHMVKQSL